MRTIEFKNKRGTKGHEIRGIQDRLFLLPSRIARLTMDNSDEIIVYSSFDSAIGASLAKTKLDAFGIPCFLTEENMSALYPGPQSFAIQVRLHVFKKDIGEVSRILMEVHVGNDPTEMSCPKCNSRKIIRDFPQRLLLEPLSSLMITFFGVFFPEKKVNHCLDCDNEF